MIDESLEYRCTIVLPQAEVFAAEDVLNLMAIAVRNRDRNGLPSATHPWIERWDSHSKVHASHELPPCTTICDDSNKLSEQPKDIPKTGEELLVWDDRAGRIRSSILRELYLSARNRQLNLWNLFCDTPREPPNDPADIDFWVTTSKIYRSDLIKFCQSQKIKVDIDASIPNLEEPTAADRHNNESDDTASQIEDRPSHWADYKDLARAFPAIGKTDSETLDWFKKRSGDHKRTPGFKEAYIEDSGKRGRSNRSQFDIFVIAKHLLKCGFPRPQSIATGLRKHLGAALEDYKDDYDDFLSSIS